MLNFVHSRVFTDMGKKYAFLSSATILLFAACNNNTKPFNKYGKAFIEIVKTDKGFFRGVELSDRLIDVKTLEKVEPKDQDSNYLYYEFKNEVGNLYSIEYNFSDNGISEIRVDAFYPDQIDAHLLFEDLRSYFIEKYGEVEKLYGSAQWNVKQNNYHLILEVTDESAEYKQGKVSLLIYKSLNKL